MASRRVLRSLSALEASCSGSVAGGTWDTPLHKFFSTTAVGNIQRVSNVVAPSWVRPHPTSGASAPSAQQQIAKVRVPDRCPILVQNRALDK